MYNITKTTIFFLHLFILQAIYIVLQDWKIKDAICRIKYQVTKNKWRGQDIVKLITCPLIKLQFHLG